MSATEAFFSWLSRVSGLLFGSPRPRPYERACLRAWSETLSDSQRKKLQSQLELFDIIQRQARRTKSVFYSLRDPSYRSWPEAVFFDDRSEDLRVFNGYLRGNIGDITESVVFTIYTHRGRLFSIEFDSEPGALASLRSDTALVAAQR